MAKKRDHALMEKRRLRAARLFVQNIPVPGVVRRLGIARQVGYRWHQAWPEALHHLGFGEPVARSTLAETNAQRDWRLWEALAKSLLPRARTLYAGEELGIDLDQAVYALDSTTLDLSLTLFPGARYRRAAGGVKLHTQIDLRGPIPTCLRVAPARGGDVLWLDDLRFEPGAFYLLDRAYLDFRRLGRIGRAGAFFVTRAKRGLRFARQRSRPVEDRDAGVRSDQTGHPALARARADFPSPLRKARYRDPETGRMLVFLTNHLEIPALTVARLYRLWWRIELFFRWIKGHLRIKHYYGTSTNAVKTQIWIAVALYLMVAILHKQLRAPGTLHHTFQLLSIHPFEKVPLEELLTEVDTPCAICRTPTS